MKTKSDVLKIIANDIADQFSKKCISILKGYKDTLSGDDSELVNVWEEICMQVQHERSFFWDAYDETVQSLVRGYLPDLKKHEKYALWFQTDAGWDWDYDCNHGMKQEGDPPVNEEDIITHLTNYIYKKAEDYSNDNIDAFYARQ